MKDINTKENIYLEEFDIYVKPYLSYAEIQQITNATLKFDSWAERQTNIDMLVLYYATDIEDKVIEEKGHDFFLKSGIIDSVCEKIENIVYIYEAIDYTESIQRGLTQIIKYLDEQLPKKVKR